ncbi:MAG: bifunctional phosphoribosylaminoimidazolecarboxamide formyltransferase/IMP cyclohydrolase, partial [Candidatus Eisenbacteria bacterium]|nr:bifunctional phosphoribosylaminoimidazolecarboxamide formyltransferase/IMP cyclohydrolase [Candidatus Eisenbacteria bacterium]
FSSWKNVTDALSVDPRIQSDLEFAWTVCRHIRSNAIVLVKDGMTVGVGAGQTSRIDALEIAIHKAGRAGHDLQGSVLASDAFFPFSDVPERAAEVGVVAMAQPGGSVKDEESIALCREKGLQMFFTSQRIFTH